MQLRESKALKTTTYKFIFLLPKGWFPVLGSLLAPMVLCCSLFDNDSLRETQFFSGLAVYQRECLACHMEDGRGVPGIHPGLVESPWIKGSDENLIGYLLTGGFSPAVLMARFDFLTDAEVADVLSYSRAAFGSGAGAIGAAQVTNVRLKTR